MSTIYLASFFEEKNWGSGRKLSIAQFSPADIKIDGVLSFLAPTTENRRQFKSDGKYLHESRLAFAERYLSKLDSDSDKLCEILASLKDGDTLLCWERTKPNYFCHRMIVAELLRKEGLRLDGEPLELKE